MTQQAAPTAPAEAPAPAPAPERFTRVQAGAPPDAPSFVNQQQISVDIFDENRRLLTVLPYDYRNRNNLPPEAVLIVRGQHYAQFYPSGGLTPFRPGTPTQGAAAQPVATPPVPHGQQATPLPPDHWAQNRPDATTVQRPAQEAVDPAAAQDVPELASDTALLGDIIAATPDASEEDRTEVVSTILKRRRGQDVSLPGGLGQYQPVVDQFAPQVAAQDPVSPPQGAAAAAAAPAAVARPRPTPRPARK